MPLYHLSLKENLTKLTPKIPECAISMYENTTIKRVCFSDYIEGCLSALQDKPRKYYVYIPKNEISKENIYYPTVDDVRDAKYTHEVWILEEIEVKCIGIIQSFNYDWTKRYNTGKGRTTFFHYPYKWVNNFESNN